MPYNTRRKSLSLPSLGIQLPNSSRAHRSNSKPSSPDQLHLPHHPAKRVKRDHEPPSPDSSPRHSPAAETATKRQQSRRVAENTPPPSPGDISLARKVDTEGINDDIVIAVIEQLERTGNRPHLIKDLATILASNNESIQNSANPAALLSSRLSLYLKRPWTALSPCPLAKELIPVHPRKVFFFLTTRPRIALPENSDDIIAPTLNDIKRLTPSISDPSVEEDEELEHLERSRMSPSPEVELFSLELDHGSPSPSAPGDSFSGRSSLNPDGTSAVQHRPQHAPNPPLEADEKGFTETATAVRESRLKQTPHHVSIEVMDLTEMPHKKEQDFGYELFGHAHHGLKVIDQKTLASSPMIQPRPNVHVDIHDIDVEMGEASWTIPSPENIDVEDLDEMFMGF